jgi:hypothetical protein
MDDEEESERPLPSVTKRFQLLQHKGKQRRNKCEGRYLREAEGW